uniref:Tudor domain-containing protein n=1 Tax=Parastrongyloides trichosuri TaxID=131310 RepID=A0A0N5A732_PARTI
MDYSRNKCLKRTYSSLKYGLYSNDENEIAPKNKRNVNMYSGFFGDISFSSTNQTFNETKNNTREQVFGYVPEEITRKRQLTSNFLNEKPYEETPNSQFCYTDEEDIGPLLFFKHSLLKELNWKLEKSHRKYGKYFLYEKGTMDANVKWVQIICRHGKNAIIPTYNELSPYDKSRIFKFSNFQIIKVFHTEMDKFFNIIYGIIHQSPTYFHVIRIEIEIAYGPDFVKEYNLKNLLELLSIKQFCVTIFKNGGRVIVGSYMDALTIITYIEESFASYTQNMLRGIKLVKRTTKVVAVRYLVYKGIEYDNFVLDRTLPWVVFSG